MRVFIPRTLLPLLSSIHAVFFGLEQNHPKNREDFYMTMTIFCGKGGVGKTFLATACAVFDSRGREIALIDHDGGHSVQNTLGMTERISPNTLHQAHPGLHVGIVDNTKYTTILQAKDQGMPLSVYLEQFPGHEGIVPLHDMPQEFFGLMTDIPTIQKFAVLITMLSALKKAGCDSIIIDVEPTAGLQRLLSHADTLARSLQNLQSKGIAFLTAMRAWFPDIAGYIRGSYISNVKIYAEEIVAAVRDLKTARYLLVCIPEQSPVDQTFVIRAIIEEFGGKVRACIVNSTEGKPHESANIARLRDHNLPLMIMPRKEEMHTAPQKRIALLSETGEIISGFLKNISMKES